MLKVVQVQDEYTKFCWRWNVKNRYLTLQLSFCQFVVAVTSLAQHVYSYYFYENIFYCRFVNEDNAHRQVSTSGFLAHDIIIFDFGLFREILGVTDCVANYLDGGYMRCMWCVGETLAIAIALAAVTFHRLARSWLLWPMLIMQNIYCIGIVILTIATVGKLVLAVVNDLTGRLVWLALIYLLGAFANCFLNYILWHYYWHLESVEKSRKALKKSEKLRQLDEDEL